MVQSNQNLSRRFNLLLGILILLVASSAFAQAPNKAAPALSKHIALIPSSPQATIVYAEGEVFVNGELADIGTTIADQEVVKTGPDSLAEIVFEGKNALRIGPNTTLSFKLSVLSKTVDLQQGTMTAVLHKLNRSAGGGLTLHTPVAVGGVRGTSFFTSVEPNSGKTYLCICDGRIQLSDNEGNNPFEKAAAHHAGSYFNKTDKGVEITEAGMEQHSDADVESLASRIGETIDWGTIESYN